MHAKISIVDTLGTRVKAARLEKGWSQVQLADEAGMSQSAIGNIEAGQRKRPRDLLSIARALDVRPEWLEAGEGRKELGERAPLRLVTDRAYGVREAIEFIAQVAAQQRPTLRKNLANLLVDLAEHPDDPALIEQTITDIERFFGPKI